MATDLQPMAVSQFSSRELEHLFESWRTPLVRYLICSGTSREDALDVAQDTFLRLHQHLMSGGGGDNLRAWVFRVAHNAALNRKMSAERRLASAELNAAADTACPAEDPERLLLKKERLRRLHDAMKDLLPVERSCVLLRSEGLRYREIAGVLEIGVSTVADHLDRAMRKLGEKCNV